MFYGYIVPICVVPEPYGKLMQWASFICIIWNGTIRISTIWKAHGTIGCLLHLGTFLVIAAWLEIVKWMYFFLNSKFFFWISGFSWGVNSPPLLCLRQGLVLSGGPAPSEGGGALRSGSGFGEAPSGQGRLPITHPKAKLRRHHPLTRVIFSPTKRIAQLNYRRKS